MRILGANVEARNGIGETPLQTAIRKQNAGLVTSLATVADLSVHTADGMSIVDLAEFSYITLLKDYIIKERVDLQELYKVFIWTNEKGVVHDDNAFQKDTGTLGSVINKKFTTIQHVIQVMMKLDRLQSNIADIKMEVELRNPMS